MNTSKIKITAVTRKEGVSQKSGKPWTKFTVHAEGDAKFATFDAALANTANGAVGKWATVTFETTEYGNDLTGLVVDENQPEPGPEPVRDRTPDGNADWDMIGLRKTRCALWAAAIGAGLGSAEARQLVLAAEVDIFHRAPAEALEDIPF